MDQPPEFLRRSRALAMVTLGATVALLALLIAAPLLIPRQDLPSDAIMFWGILILLAAVILGVSATYVFLSRTLHLPSVDETTLPGRPPSPADTTGRPVESEAAMALRLLDGDERRLFQALLDANGTSWQRDLARGTNFSNSKVSRLLDRLEGRRLVVRERQGMANRVRQADHRA